MKEGFSMPMCGGNECGKKSIISLAAWRYVEMGKPHHLERNM
jgi:hypothetical protein